MKTVWKWVLGILAAVIVLGVLFAMPFMFHMYFPASGYGYGHMPMHGGFGPGYYSPMMGGGYGMMGYGGGLFGGLIQLGILVLIVLGIIWLVRAIRGQDAPKNN